MHLTKYLKTHNIKKATNQVKRVNTRDASLSKNPNKMILWHWKRINQRYGREIRPSGDQGMSLKVHLSLRKKIQYIGFQELSFLKRIINLNLSVETQDKKKTKRFFKNQWSMISDQRSYYQGVRWDGSQGLAENLMGFVWFLIHPRNCKYN